MSPARRLRPVGRTRPHAESAPSARPGRTPDADGRQDRQRIGVDDHRQVGVECESQCSNRIFVGAETGSTTRTAPGRQQRRSARPRLPASATPPRPPQIRRTASSRTWLPPPRRCTVSPHGIGRRAGQDAGDALAVLVVVRVGHRPVGLDVGGVQRQPGRWAVGPVRCPPVRRARNRPARGQV